MMTFSLWEERERDLNAVKLLLIFGPGPGFNFATLYSNHLAMDLEQHLAYHNEALDSPLPHIQNN